MRARRTSCALLLCLNLLASSAAAQARTQIVVLTGETGAANASLVEALLIQLADSEVAVASRPVPRAADAETVARDLLDAREAQMAIWLTRLDANTCELHWALLRDDAVAIEETRVSGRPGPALERTIALKVRELLDALQRDQRGQRAARTDAKVSGAKAPSSPPPAPRRAGVSPLRRVPQTQALTPVLEASAAGMTASGSASAQGALGVAAGAALPLGMTRGEGWLRVHWVSPLAAATTAGRVETSEFAPEMSLRMLRRFAPSWLGGHAGFALRVIHARGVTARGERGERTRVVPTITAGVEGRLPLLDALWLRCALGAELALKAQRFSVDHQTLLTFGTLRGRGELSFVFAP